jgi:glucokinase
VAAIGVDLGGTKIRAGRVRVDGTIARELEVATDEASGDAILAQIVALARDLADGEAVPVGVGVPGTVDQATGTLVQAANLPLHDVPVRDRLRALLGVPVRVENDANCAALGEHRFGAARGTAYSVMLTLGTGVGGGVVIDGSLYGGARGTGAELGHVVIALGGRPCQGSCRGRGHLEAYCSGTALTLRAHDVGIADARAVLDGARAGDATALGLLREVSDALGAALVTFANTFNPEIFVVGGGLGEAAAPFLLAPATAILRAESMAPNGDVPVVAALLGNDAGMVGAAALHLP